MLLKLKGLWCITGWLRTQKYVDLLDTSRDLPAGQEDHSTSEHKYRRPAGKHVAAFQTLPDVRGDMPVAGVACSWPAASGVACVCAVGLAVLSR